MQKWCELKFDKKQTYDTLEIIQTSSGLIMLQVHELWIHELNLMMKMVRSLSLARSLARTYSLPVCLFLSLSRKTSNQTRLHKQRMVRSSTKRHKYLHKSVRIYDAETLRVCVCV